MNHIKKVIVIGCSGAGATAARMIKKIAPSVEVTIIREADEQGLLTRCATPYICSGNVLRDPAYKDDNIFTNHKIKLVNIKAVDINKKEKFVTTADGKQFSYNKLVLATGAEYIMPDISGTNLSGVFSLRKSIDAVNILNWLNNKRVKSVALIGAGAIGIELAYLLAQHGIKITLVEAQNNILSKALDPDMSHEIENYIKEKSIDLHSNEKITAITGKYQIENIVLASGKKIKTEMVIISVGAKPRLELAKKAGLEIGKLGLIVNKYLQTSDPDIYSAGDLIQYPSFITGEPILGQLRPNAVIGGRIIGKNIIGHKIEYPGFINSFATKFFDKSIAGTGLTENEANAKNIKTVSAIQSSVSKHSMMKNKKPYKVKLIFNKKNKNIIGGQIVSDSECPIKHIDVITLAIRARWTALELSTLRCAGQPELSPDPGMEPITLAAEAAQSVFDNESES